MIGMLLLVAAVAALGTGWFKSRKASELAKAAWSAQWAEQARQVRELETALADARHPPTVAPVSPRTEPVVARPSAEELLQRLAQLRPGRGPERIPTLRDIIYHLEALERLGESAVPPIRSFLLRFEDVAYDPDTAPAEEPAEPRPSPQPPRGGGNQDAARAQREQMEQLGRALTRRASGRSLPRMNYEFPPTLRIGLLDTLKDIGGEPAEAAVAEVMQQSGRALEVAYAAKTLKAMSGDRWREPALAAAHELLLHPPDTGSTARVDRRAEDFLYAVLELFADTGFADVAGQRLIRADGTLDRGSFNYLVRTLQQNALPTFEAVFNHPGVTNLADRASLLQQAMPYLGADPHANSMFASVVTNPDLPAQVRGMVLQSLARTGEGDDKMDLALVQQRYDLLQNLKPQLDVEAYRRVNASLSRQLGYEVPADEAPRNRRSGGEGRPRGGQP